LGPCLGHNASRRGTSIGSPLEPVSGSVFSRCSHQRERVTWEPTASPRSSTRNTFAQMPGRKVRPGKPRDRDEALMTNVGARQESNRQPVLKAKLPPVPILRPAPPEQGSGHPLPAKSRRPEKFIVLS